MDERDSDGVGEEKEVLVGVDGSRASSVALAWAAEEARLRGARLRVLRAWQVPAVDYAGFANFPAELFDSLAQSAAEQLRSQVAEVLGSADAPDVELEAVEGPASKELLDRAAKAEMVVVGAHGRGGLGGLLLGSVSSLLAHHAPCPVVIVRK